MTASTALYVRVMDDLTGRRKGLGEPERLPAESELAAQMDVGRDTLRRALKVLEEQGAVTRRRGRGTYLQPLVASIGSLEGKNIGFVPPWWADSSSAWFTSRVLEGVTRWSDEHECHLSVLHADRRPASPESWIEQLGERGMSGMLWLQPRPEQMALVERCAGAVPTVVVGREYPHARPFYVAPDYAQAARLLDECMVAHGHDTYAVVGTSIQESYSQTWIRALKEVHAARGSEFQCNWQFMDIKPFDREKLASLLLDHYLSCHEEVSAFVLTSSSYLLPLIRDAEFRSRIESRSLSVATVDYGLYPPEAYWPGRTITHVVCDWAQVGQRAMATLSMIATGADVPQALRVPVTFEPGQTVFASTR